MDKKLTVGSFASLSVFLESRIIIPSKQRFQQAGRSDEVGRAADHNLLIQFETVRDHPLQQEIQSQDSFVEGILKWTEK
jgi:hypothetical protein